MTMVIGDEITDPNIILAKSPKYQTIHFFCDKMINHISILLGIMNFSSNKQTEENAEALTRCAPFIVDYPIPEQGTMYYLCENGACKAPVSDFSKLDL